MTDAPGAFSGSSFDLSVIIPCHNAGDVLADQLDALASEPGGSWEVIVVDNGSTDDTLSVAVEYAPRFDHFRVVDASRRQGRHHACNTGASAATGRSLVFVDADDRVAPGFIDVMGRALRSVAVAVPRFDYTALNGPAARDLLYQTSGVEDTDFLPAGSGSGFAIRRELFADVGGFDETMTYCEDMDLSWRASLAGFSPVWVEDAVLYPRQRGDLRAMFRQHLRYGIAAPGLFKKFRAAGMRRRGLGQVAADWRMIILSVPRLRSRDVRVRWVRRAGRAVGRAWGSVRHRVVYL